MKKTKQEQIYNIDEIEDLTLFANESFDTQEVDLFEFSSEESSPLTRLKSIILSLDWEINDETLQELADELQNMQATWQGDKVAEVYLQGLEKIGRYLRSKGAYAHPNSIKLLLTFFYNFEKITSSPNLSGEDITKILKSDIRKFKILQYQINQSEEIERAPATPSTEQQGTPVVPVGMDASSSEPNPLKLLKAAILSLDWEVTDESLRQFNVRLDQYQETVSENRLVMVMVQGLRALGDYIGEERAEAHPEAFPLLHSFSDALDQVAQVDESATDQSKVQDILVEQISRLNNLKLLIAAPQEARIDEQLINEVVGEISAPVAMEDIAEEPFAQTEAEKRASHAFDLPTDSPAVMPATAASGGQEADISLESELDILFGTEAKPAMESADTQYPDEILPPEAITPVEDELADDLIEASLHTKRGLMPALSGVEDTSAFRDDVDQADTKGQADLNQQLDDLFAEAENASSIPPSPSLDFEESLPGGDAAHAGPVTATVAIDEEDDDQPALGSLNLEDSDGMTVAALSDVEAPEDRFEPESPVAEIDGGMSDLDAKLDSFFGEEPLEVVAPSLSLSDESEVAPALEDDEPIQAELTVAALSDSDIELADVTILQPEDVKPESLDIESELDGFFSDDTVVAVEDVMQTTSTGPSVEEVEQSLYFGAESPVEAALADSDEDKGFSEEEALAALEYTPLEEIEENFDAFFGSETAEELLPEADQIDAAAGQLVPAEGLTFEEETPALGSDLFAGFETEQEEIVPALASFDQDMPAAEELVAAVAGRKDEADRDLDEKLDFFFDEEAAEPAPAVANAPESPARQPEIEDLLTLENEVPALSSDLLSEILEEDADVVPALAAAFDEGAEELTPAAGIPGEEVPDRDLDDQLDYFFAAEENVAAESVTETVSELTQALEAATLDGRAPAAAAFPGLLPGTGSEGEGMEVVLASLGALLPGVVRAPGRGPVTESMRLLDRLQQQAASPEHRSLAQLLNSTVSLLGRTAGKDKTETEKLVNFLYEQLLHKEINANAVTEAVSRFAGWMQNLCATMPLVPEKTGEEREPRFEYTAKELYFELSEMRASFREELAKLRHEMHHRH